MSIQVHAKGALEVNKLRENKQNKHNKQNKRNRLYQVKAEVKAIQNQFLFVLFVFVWAC